MLPLRDTIRSYTFPVVNWLIIGANEMVLLINLYLQSGVGRLSVEYITPHTPYTNPNP